MVKYMEFNIGDNVLIRQHTQDEKDNYPFGWTLWMDAFEGNVGTVISRCTDRRFNKERYLVKYNSDKYHFVASSLRPDGYDQF